MSRTLSLDVDTAIEAISHQIEVGEAMMTREIKQENELSNVDYKRKLWLVENDALIKIFFHTTEISTVSNNRILKPVGPYRSVAEKVVDFRSHLKADINVLKKAESELKKYRDASELTIVEDSHIRKEHQVDPASKKVFIVHGRDEDRRQEVRDVLLEFGYEPIILDKQPNQGKTLIEKFIEYSDVAYAVVLITPDDIGFLSGANNEMNPRARQNVIFELGYFYGILGRERVCVLQSGVLEKPSDISGIVHISFEDDEWKTKLKKEIEQVIRMTGTVGVGQ
ncbi:MAG: TIR domain-containing protein [Armatimonadota bacterium]